ncbi:nuclear transport factor 2 family protein [Roseovarius spongiae]|uniref:Nuclear transport factor 2 family protein n=1 Tax=Roseovarius spongiae TaxID=2320272 RepID=A0A3A8B3H2_9RHOB|nr:nuclear transport factor 2 family protein [Roseovarius spongiae]RKF15302.1 nuclear transport factor 2 family protein [Roseovarius spongiae]
MSDKAQSTHLPGDPEQWVRDLAAIWKAHDGVRAAQGYTEDAVLHWGPGRRQSGAALRERPARWFAYASDLEIDKEYVAHTDDCIVTTWRSAYTDPETGDRMQERGIETFRFENGLIREQHAWQHSWKEGEDAAVGDFSTD